MDDKKVGKKIYNLLRSAFLYFLSSTHIL